MTIARTGSRGAFVGLLATGVALLVLASSIPIAKRLLFVLITAVTLVLAAPKGYWDQMETMLKPKEDYNWSSTNGRREVTLRGIGYMLNYPVFGLGINNFWRAECIDVVSVKVKFHQSGTGLRCMPPHNSTLQAGAELGITGLTLWLMLLVGGIRGMLRLRRQLPAQWLHGDEEERQPRSG
jgi:O-antigen ligase